MGPGELVPTYWVKVSGVASTTVKPEVIGTPGRKLAIAGQYLISDSSMA